MSGPCDARPPRPLVPVPPCPAPGACSCSCFLRWRSRLVCCPKQRLHRWHLKGFSLLWMLRTCRCRLDEMLKDRSQYLHLQWGKEAGSGCGCGPAPWKAADWIPRSRAVCGDRDPGPGVASQWLGDDVLPAACAPPIAPPCAPPSSHSLLPIANSHWGEANSQGLLLDHLRSLGALGCFSAPAEPPHSSQMGKKEGSALFPWGLGGV